MQATWALVAVLAGSGCGASEPGGAAAEPGAAPKTLVFVSDRDNPPPEDEDLLGGLARLELYVQTDRRPIRRLTRNTTFDATPACSPDARHIAYASGADGGGIFVMQLDGTGRRRVTRGSDFQPTWSPAGDRIAFVREDADGRTRLYLVADGGGRVRPLLDVLDASSPAWSPRGDRIAFLRAPDPDDVRLDLYVAGVDGRAPKRIFRGLSRGQISWSARGDELAVTRNVGGMTRIWIVTVATRRARKLTESTLESPQGSPAWSPSGSLIAFGETAGLAVVEHDGSDYRQLHPGPDQFDPPLGQIGDWVTYTQPSWCRG